MTAEQRAAIAKKAAEGVGVLSGSRQTLDLL
jgi:hypothetical protein